MIRDDDDDDDEDSSTGQRRRTFRRERTSPTAEDTHTPPSQTSQRLLLSVKERASSCSVTTTVKIEPPHVKLEAQDVHSTTSTGTTGAVKSEAVEGSVSKATIKEEQDDLVMMLSPANRDLYRLLALIVDLHLFTVSASTAAEHLKYNVAYMKTIVESSKRYEPSLKLQWIEAVDENEAMIAVKR
jgi:hypothetical protein